MVLFFSRAICGSGPDVEVPAPGAAVVVEVAPKPVVPLGAAGAPEAGGAPPNRLDVGGAEVEAGGGALEVVAVLPPPNNPPSDGAAEVEEAGAVVVLLVELNIPPRDGAEVFAGVELKRVAVGAVVGVETAGVGGLLAPRLKGLGLVGFVGAAPKRPPDEVGGALVVGAEPKRPPAEGAEVVFVEGAEPKRPPATGAEVVVAAGFEPNRPPEGVEEVVFAVELKRLLVGGALAVGAPPNRPPD